MTHVDIYLLQDDSLDRNHYACRLIEKAYRRQHHVYVQTSSQEHAETLDELLWTFKEESFIPHNLLGEGPHKAPPVQLSTQTAPKQHLPRLKKTLRLSKIKPSETLLRNTCR